MVLDKCECDICIAFVFGISTGVCSRYSVSPKYDLAQPQL